MFLNCEPSNKPAKQVFRLNSISDSLVELNDHDEDAPRDMPWPKPIIPPPVTIQSTVDYLPLILNARVYDVSVETPLQFARKLSDRFQSKIYIKREDLQPIYSFKCRGAFNKMYHLAKEQKTRGVCCVSAGNHAQGVAMAAQKLGIKATIVMPTFAPEIKVENVRRLGAKVILYGNDFDEAKKECLRIVEQEKLVFVPPFDDPLVIAGQGTVGMEILNQIRQTRLDAVFVCCGGGGLLAGIAAFIKRVRPEVKVIGVNTFESDSMYQSLHAGKPVLLERAGLFSDGTSVKLVGSECVKLCQQYLDDMVKVTNDELCAAIKDCYEENRGIIEPAGALGVAGLKKYLTENPGLRGGVFAAVTSGANMNFDRLRFVTERSSVGEGREALLSVLIPECPGTLKRLHDIVFPRSITELSYRYSSPNEAHVFLGFQSLPQDIDKITAEINKQNDFEALNITQNEMASQHVRYMSGGRSNTVPDEWLIRLRLPERPGAMKDFFSLLEKDWSFTLFHYRNHGADYARILVGIQIPNKNEQSVKAFLERMQASGIKDVVDETSNPIYTHFIRSH